MKLGLHALALILGLGLVAPALAQEEPKKEEPAKEEAAKPAAEAAPAAVPAKEETAKPAAEVAPVAATAPAAAPVAEPPKELSSCAKSFVPLSDSYKNAYDDMQKWINQIDTQTAAVADKVAKLQTQFEQNQAAITQAKLANDSAKAKDLDKASKKIWDDLTTAKKDLSGICGKFAKDAQDKVKQYTDATNKALDTLKAQTK